MSELNNTTSTNPSVKKPAFSLLRCLLAFYFCCYTYVVAIGMIPLPDEPSRINFYGLFCVTAGLVIAYHFLVSRYFLFYLSVLTFLPLAARQLATRIKFLEMMLEPNLLFRVTRYSLAVIALAMLMPPTWRLFRKKSSEYKRPSPLFFRKGVPF